MIQTMKLELSCVRLAAKVTVYFDQLEGVCWNPSQLPVFVDMSCQSVRDN